MHAARWLTEWQHAPVQQAILETQLTTVISTLSQLRGMSMSKDDNFFWTNQDWQGGQKGGFLADNI